MTKYDIIFEALQEKVDSGELTLEDAEIVNDLAYDKYVCEKKTKAEYRERSFKKKYDFIPDKPGARTGTILVNGKRQRVDFDRTGTIDATALDGVTKGKLPRQTKVDLLDDENTISLDSNFFKLKGSKQNQRRDAILQHEVGHTRLHSITPTSKTLDKSKSTPHAQKKSLDASIKSFQIDPDSLDKETRRELNQAIKSDQYKKMSLSNSTKDDRIERNRGIDTASKYDKKNNNHLSSIEIEADRYAANRTSSSALKRGLREFQKKSLATNSTKKQIAKQFNIDPEYIDDDDVKNYKAGLNAQMREDLSQRSKALKDKDLISNKSYK